jgi:hypothetical protein
MKKLAEFFQPSYQKPVLSVHVKEGITKQGLRMGKIPN